MQKKKKKEYIQNLAIYLSIIVKTKQNNLILTDICQYNI